MTDHETLHSAEGDYEIIVEETQYISFIPYKVSAPMWAARLVFKDSNGHETATGHYADTTIAHDKNQRRVRCRLIKALGNFRAYRKRTGLRFEVGEMNDTVARIEVRNAERTARKAAKVAA
ncbi:hypothetical protein BB934_45400 (plasmid) [Microvirga ossetica]|uniref:Uncharacterized protein n=1 Tax=Microvirga ossetica TaxID=1882682 RepID=A0A1B2EZW3_9HYPH|nr:hypothetical protein [Microvirga ossetica]ANY85458.1 hypothetical protein BB934_45400 [Microvirga ossetica]